MRDRVAPEVNRCRRFHAQPELDPAAVAEAPWQERGKENKNKKPLLFLATTTTHHQQHQASERSRLETGPETAEKTQERNQWNPTDADIGQWQTSRPTPPVQHTQADTISLTGCQMGKTPRPTLKKTPRFPAAVSPSRDMLSHCTANA